MTVTHHELVFGDDYGAQANMLFSPKMWWSLIEPRLARLFTPAGRRWLLRIQACCLHLHTDS